MRKAISFWVVLLLVFCGIAMDTVRGGEGDVLAFHQRIDKALNEKSGISVVSVLGDLDSSEPWGFGNGVGPIDGDYLQILALRSVFRRLVDDKGRLSTFVSASDMQALHENARQWVNRIQKEPEDRRALIDMLDNKKPAVRWLGLKKTDYLSQLDSALTDKLSKIMHDDPYVRILLHPVRSEMNRPPSPGRAESEFECPLRNMACEILNRHQNSRKNEVDINAVCARGIKYLIEMYNTRTDKRNDIIEAVQLLNPQSPGITALRKMHAETVTNATINVLYLGIEPLKDR